MKISVCIATYNGEKYIKEQLESILVQLNIEDEIIISDDHSTDKTIGIIEALNEKRIKVYKNTKEKGYTKNFENALEKAIGDIIFLSDQDDIWVKKKVKTMTKYLQDYDFVVSDNMIVDEDLTVIEKSHFNFFSTKQGFVNNLLLPRYVGACMAFRRNVLIKSLPFPPNVQLVAHDYWISLISEFYFSVYKINEPLILYRRHTSNASSGGNKSTNSLKHKLMVRAYTLFYIVKRFF